MSTTADRATAPASSRTYPAYSRPWVLRTLLTREFAVIAVLVLVYVYSSVNIAYFDSSLTIYNLLRDNAPILLMALPMTLIIITGEIDLSVSSTLAVSAATAGVLVKEHSVPIGLAIVVALLLGCVLGALNGFLVAYVGLPSLAVTIGTLALYRGLTEGLIQTNRIAQFPASWQDLAGKHLGGVTSPWPLVLVPMVVLTIVFGVLLHFTTFGRGVYEIGNSSEAAHFSGVEVARTKFLLFVLSGLVASFAGIYVMLRADSVATDTGTGYELKVIASVLLGGVSIFGGRGAMHGVIAGVLLIAVLNSALLLDNQGSEIIQIIIGLLLVVSVISSSLLQRIRNLVPRRVPAIRPTNAPTAGDESRKVAP
jgi:rhamnose transport system permease protein